MLETFTLLGALAVATSTIELGTMVVNVHNRTPATLAVAAASVEAIAERPVRLGLGAGSAPDSRWSAEMRAIGQPVAPTLGRAATPASSRCSTCSSGCTTPTAPAELATFPRPRHADAGRARRQRPGAGRARRAARRRRQRRLGPPPPRRAARRRRRGPRAAATASSCRRGRRGRPTCSTPTTRSVARWRRRPRPARPRRPRRRRPRAIVSGRRPALTPRSTVASVDDGVGRVEPAVERAARPAPARGGPGVR